MHRNKAEVCGGSQSEIHSLPATIHIDNHYGSGLKFTHHDRLSPVGNHSVTPFHRKKLAVIQEQCVVSFIVSERCRYGSHVSGRVSCIAFTGGVNE